MDTDNELVEKKDPNIDYSLPKDLQRWYKLIPHPEQLRLVKDNVRFKVCAAGRRSGKTERAKRFIVKTALRAPELPQAQYFIAAPTYNQVKRIYWDDLLKLTFQNTIPSKVSQSDLFIEFLHNGARISLIGLDKPARLEGTNWTGGIIDEIASIKPESWEANLRPALGTHDPTRPDYRPWLWFIGVPEGLNHFYDLAQLAKNPKKTNWSFYHWKSDEVLPADEILDAKATMSERMYKQEYEASFETATGRIYDDYSEANYTSETIQPHEQLLWMHDFNFSPLSSAIGVIRDNALYILDEIILRSAVARQSAQEFIDRYKNHANKQLILYGDPSGKAGEKHGHASDYREMENLLRKNGFSFTRNVRSKAPAIRDRQNAVRAKIRAADGRTSLFINTDKCPYSHKGLSTVQFKKGSTFLEEDGEYQHITTAIGYCVEFIWPVRLDTPTVHEAPVTNPLNRMWREQRSR